MANKNTEYEILAQEIYQELNSSKEVKPIEVKHNVKLEGKSGIKHQIDVYWEFEMMGELHKVAIECKNYNKPVSVGKIRDFYGALSDIGNIQGIFISKEGYQKGAKTYANSVGISLKEMRFPKDEDWEGRFRDMTLEIKIVNIDIKERTLKFDMNWILDNTNYKEGDQITINRCTDEMKILDENRNIITSIYEIDNSLNKELKQKKNIKYSKEFDNCFIESNYGELLKIDKIDYLYDILELKNKSIFSGDKIAKAILKDVKTGEIKFYNINGDLK